MLTKQQLIFLYNTVKGSNVPQDNWEKIDQLIVQIKDVLTELQTQIDAFVDEESPEQVPAEGEIVTETSENATN